MNSLKKKLLLQACCGPCAAYSDAFSEYQTIIYFNGNNFDTADEYERRLMAINTVNDHIYKSKMVVAPYSAQVFANCEDCIGARLRACAHVARENGFDCFSTTLTVSPHKDAEIINGLGREIAKEVGVPFIEFNLKKNGGFQKSIEVSKRLGLYRQNYCGCARSRV